jgi:hypothetical protein
MPLVVRVKWRKAPHEDGGDAMKYLLTFVVDEGRMAEATPEETRSSLDRWSAFDREATEAGAMIACEPLEHSSTATTIRIGEDGERLTTDGPFAETKEQLGGFCLLECANLDEALEWASRVPMVAGSIEVRAVMDLSEFGYESATVRPAKAAA